MLGVTVGNPKLTAGAAVPERLTIRLCSAQPDRPVADTVRRSSMLRAQPYATCDSIERVIGTVVVETPGTKRLVPLTSRLGTIVDTAPTTRCSSPAPRTPTGHTESGRFYSGIFRVTQTRRSRCCAVVGRWG